jgi:F0F1-type ATP synthase assembly protein I
MNEENTYWKASFTSWRSAGTLIGIGLGILLDRTLSSTSSIAGDIIFVVAILCFLVGVVWTANIQKKNHA